MGQLTRHKLEGRIVAAGPTTAKRLSLMLGMNPRITDYRLTSVGWFDQMICAELDIGGNRSLVVQIQTATNDAKGIVKTEHIVVSYVGGSMPRSLARLIAREGPVGFANKTLVDLANLLSDDPELGRPGLPLPATDHTATRPQSMMNDWGGDNVWADFFAPNELGRGQLDSLGFHDSYVFAQHSEHECSQLSPVGLAPVGWLNNLPWQNRIRSDREAEPSILLRVDVPFITTDLSENDIIMGNQNKLLGLIDECQRIAENQGKGVFFANTCTPIMVGEDVESNVTREGDCSGCNTNYLTVNERSMTNVFHEVMVVRRLAAEQAAAPCLMPRINLVGLEERQDGFEVMELIDKAGIAINTLFIPSLPDERIAQFPNATLNVILANQVWSHLYDQLMFESRIPHLKGVGPWGVEGTKRFVRSIVDRMKIEDDFEATFDEYLEPHLEEWERLKESISGHRLGFVLRGAEAYYFNTPGATWGIPLVAMLEEMGFGLDFLIKLEDREQARTAAGLINGVFKHPERHSIGGFDTQEMMTAKLKASPCQAVFSNHTMDWRITESGKSIFSYQQFEKGVPGALRTAERLLGLCKTPYYSRYRRYLARTEAGARRPITEVEAQASATQSPEATGAAALQEGG